MKRSVGVMVVLGVVLVAAIGIWVWNPWMRPSTSTDNSSVASDIEVAPRVGARAPSFTLPTLDGGDVSLADFGGQPVILEFWASWCPNCNATAPHLERFLQRRDDVAVIGINMGLNESEDAIRSFVDEHGLGFPIALDDGSVTETYRVTKTSTYVFIDAGGIIREIQSGVRMTLSDFETAFENTLNPEG